MTTDAGALTTEELGRLHADIDALPPLPSENLEAIAAVLAQIRVGR